MKSLNRAKRFISQNTRAIALTIVPLAGLTVGSIPGQAFVKAVQGFNATGTCSVSGIGGASVSGTCAETSNGLDPSTGLVGVKVYGDNSDLEPTAVGSGIFGVDITATGTANVSGYVGAIPVSWDFTTSFTGSGIPATYQITYSLYGTTPTGLGLDGAILPTATFTSALSSGTGSLLLSGQTITSYSIDLKVTEFGTGTLSVNIPTNSLDIDSATAAATPEPASVLLLGTGLAGMLLRRFRRGRQ
ncbi:MAG: PEP-CTERM sorting domain-containing protein [Acidobacteriota bacterium]|nr:PEP-CTERM sorting domain-containing protein [Acidobacteriota bacterium]